MNIIVTKFSEVSGEISWNSELKNTMLTSRIAAYYNSIYFSPDELSMGIDTPAQTHSSSLLGLSSFMIKLQRIFKNRENALLEIARKKYNLSTLQTNGTLSNYSPVVFN